MFDVIFSVLLIVQGIVLFFRFYKTSSVKRTKDVLKSNYFKRLYMPLLILSVFLFFIAAILFIQKDMLWIVVTLVAALFSQYLIIANWKTIWYGTFINVLIGIGILIYYTSWKMEKIIDEKVNLLYANKIKSSSEITEAMISDQPPVIQKWLFRANVMDKDMIELVHLNQIGAMRTSPSGTWMNVEAKEYFTTTKPAFLWIAEVDGGWFMKLRGIDQYRNGKGHMQIQWFSLFPVVNSSGSEIDQGSLLRYMAEMVWFPSCALKPYIQWEEIDSMHAKATMHYGQVKASGIFTFNLLGDVVSFESKRYYERKEGATLEDWLVIIDDTSCKEFQGIRVPTKASICWKLKSGTFNWFKLEVQNIEYNHSTKDLSIYEN